jgi:hypothetical protein
MNLLSLIIIFLAIVICVAVAYIAWQLTAVAAEEQVDSDAGDSADSDTENTPPRQ